MIKQHLYRSNEFEEWFSNSEFREQRELLYPLLVAWSNGYEDGLNKGIQKVKDEIHNTLYGRKEMGG